MPKHKRRPPSLSDEAVRLVAARFRALGDPTRLRVLNTLMEGEFSVQELVEATGLEQPTVSRHLSVLRRDAVVERRSDGNRAYYSICDPTVVELCRIVCAGLAGQASETLDSLPEDRFWRGEGI